MDLLSLRFTMKELDWWPCDQSLRASDNVIRGVAFSTH